MPYQESGSSNFIFGKNKLQQVSCCGHGWVPKLFRKGYKVAFNSKLSEEQIRAWLDILTLLFGIRFTLSNTLVDKARYPYMVTATLTKKHLTVHGAVRLIWSHSTIIANVLKHWKGDVENILLVIWGCSPRLGNHFFGYNRVPKETLEVIKNFQKLPPSKVREEKIHEFFSKPIVTKGWLLDHNQELLDEYTKRFEEYKKT